MHYNKKFVSFLIALLLGLVAIGGGMYLINQTTSPQTANTKTPQPPINTTDTIRVVSPNGGEVYAIGSVVTLKSVGGHKSDTGGIENGYFLVDAAGHAKEITYAGNTYQWKIGSYSNGAPIVPGVYTLRVTSSFGPCPNAACAQTIQDDSDGSFTITQ